MVLKDGTVLSSSEEVHDAAVHFYQDLLTKSSIEYEASSMELLLLLVSIQENEGLCAILSIEEVKSALWSIPSNSSLGSDGFTTSFFIIAWDIVKDDLVEMAKEFFEGKPLTTFFCATNLVLIPKVDEPLGFGQFRPISFCSIVYKIMSKIMELVSGINQKASGRNVMVKIDMATAYDRGIFLRLLEDFAKMGDGHLSMGSPVVGEVDLKVSEVIDDTGPKYELLRELVPEEVVDHIRK
ncbi:uncharacterized protein LOC121242351 [Juglans microcarpa x Juglans regia]|uniref:uncharacterized protein LOC121242351 n=1 Tax=Juglans microcarpa x Juglans regia TaxID=2249226 RepID=UPI001B7F483E|nr:uncharacterized protein LOC121242351 [Juglans microcarpa x Juglans regia]